MLDLTEPYKAAVLEELLVRTLFVVVWISHGTTFEVFLVLVHMLYLGCFNFTNSALCLIKLTFIIHLLINLLL